MASQIYFWNVALLLSFTIAATSSLSFVTDEKLTAIMDSTGGLVVVTAASEDLSPEVIDAVTELTEAATNLHGFDVKVYIVNCKISQSALCNRTDESEDVRLYRNGEHVVDLSTSSIVSLPSIKEVLLSNLKPKHLTKISSVEHWNDVMRSCAGVRNVVLFYATKHSSKLFRYAIRASMWYEGRIEFTFSTDPDIISQMVSSSDDWTNGGVWMSLCAEEPANQKCQTFPYLHDIVEENLNRTLHSLLSPSVVLSTTDDAVNALEAAYQRAMDDQYDLILLIAGKEKRKKVEALARKACGLTMGKARCFVIHQTSQTSETAHFVKSNRIHLTVLALEGHHEDIEVGYLASESDLEVYHHWERLVTMRERKHGSSDIEPLLEEHEYQPIIDANDVQDDPVAFAVHHNKALRDVCLFDRKVMTHLTDVTYDDVINGGHYAVILFTLEFNAKSLAVYSTFIQIHQNLKDRGNSLPLYRVECFDWPDVCEKAGFTTYPQMMIYGGGRETPLQYDGVWSEEMMLNTIVMHSVTWPVVVQSEDKLRSIFGVDVIYGLALSEEGEMIFKEAAAKLKEKFAFIITRGGATHALSSLRSVDGSNTLVAFSKNRFLSPSGHFSTLDDVIAFVNSSFAKKPVKELTIYNFQEAASSSKPLFIQFTNVTNSSPRFDEHLYDIISAVQDRYNEKARFMWMDGSAHSAGEYVLYMHSGEKPAHTSVSYMNINGEVSFKSFQPEVGETEMTQWIDDCLTGKSPISFTKIDMDWSPRLPGHDYLRYMKEDGTLPDPDPPSEGKTSSNARIHKMSLADEIQDPNPSGMAHTEL